MSFVLLAAVIWVALTLVVIGACVAAARGDRAVIDDADALPLFGSASGVSPAPSTLIGGASSIGFPPAATPGRVHQGRRARGAHARPRPSQLARR